MSKARTDIPYQRLDEDKADQRSIWNGAVQPRPETKSTPSQIVIRVDQMGSQQPKSLVEHKPRPQVLFSAEKPLGKNLDMYFQILLNLTLQELFHFARSSKMNYQIFAAFCGGVQEAKEVFKFLKQTISNREDWQRLLKEKECVVQDIAVSSREARRIFKWSLGCVIGEASLLLAGVAMKLIATNTQGDAMDGAPSTTLGWVGTGFCSVAILDFLCGCPSVCGIIKFLMDPNKNVRWLHEVDAKLHEKINKTRLDESKQQHFLMQLATQNPELKSEKSPVEHLKQKAFAIKSKQAKTLDVEVMFMAHASSALFFKPATLHQQAQSRLAGALAPNHRGA